MTFVNNDNGFPSLGDMACNYPCHDHFQFLPGHWQTKRTLLDFLRPINTQLLENNPNNSSNNMKSQIENKGNRSISLWNY